MLIFIFVFSMALNTISHASAFINRKPRTTPQKFDIKQIDFSTIKRSNACYEGKGILGFIDNYAKVFTIFCYLLSLLCLLIAIIIFIDKKMRKSKKWRLKVGILMISPFITLLLTPTLLSPWCSTMFLGRSKITGPPFSQNIFLKFISI